MQWGYISIAVCTLQYLSSVNCVYEYVLFAELWTFDRLTNVYIVELCKLSWWDWWVACKIFNAQIWSFEHLAACAVCRGPFQVCVRWYSTNLSWIMTSQCSLSLRIIHLHCSLLKAISSAGSFRGPPHHLQMILHIKTHYTMQSLPKYICIQAMCLCLFSQW